MCTYSEDDVLRGTIEEMVVVRENPSRLRLKKERNYWINYSIAVLTLIFVLSCIISIVYLTSARVQIQINNTTFVQITWNNFKCERQFNEQQQQVYISNSSKLVHLSPYYCFYDYAETIIL